mgnify:CR=1 FL=1
MLQVKDLNNAETAFGGGSFEHLPSGVYKVSIENVFDNQRPKNGKQARLEIELEIADGEHKGFFTEAYKKLNFWSLILFENYGDEKSLPFFKGFIKRMMDSNPTYKYTPDETKMIGCSFYASIQAVETVSSNGKKYWKYNVMNVYSTKEFTAKKDYNGNPLAEYSDKPNDAPSSAPSNNSTEINYDITDDDVQF